MALSKYHKKSDGVCKSIGLVSPIKTKPAQYCGAIILPSALAM